MSPLLSYELSWKQRTATPQEMAEVCSIIVTEDCPGGNKKHLSDGRTYIQSPFMLLVCGTYRLALLKLDCASEAPEGLF